MTLNADQLPSTSADAVKRPNRRQTEVTLADLTRRIDIKNDELEKLGGCVGTQAILVRLRNDYANFKKQRKDINEQLKSPENGKFAKKEELKEMSKLKKEEMAKIEYTDLAYKDERKLIQRLNGLQNQYENSTFKNASVELGLVKEIDKLKRNLKRLDKYNKLKAEKEELNRKEKEIDREINTLRKERRKIEFSMQECKIEEMKVVALRRELNDLSNQKKRLMANYSRQIEDYTNYKQSLNQANQSKRQQNDGKSVKRTSSWKRSRHNVNDEYSSDSDSCDYEPFTKEKQLCRTLMAYLQNYLTEPNRPTENDPSGSSGRSKKEDSDEEGQTGSPKHVTKKHSKKEKRRTTQAIPLEPHVMNDFERVCVIAPVNYNEVPIAFEKLKERLQYYENQLSLNFDFSYPNDDYASSESELTFDSARFSVMTMSEADESMSSSMGQSLSQNSGFGTYLKNQSSLSFDIESPKSVDGAPVAFNLAARLSRSSSCMNKGEFTAASSREISEPDSDSFDVAKLKNKSSSLSCLSSTGGDQQVEPSKSTPQDEGIDVFLSKDSSANSNIRFKI